MWQSRICNIASLSSSFAASTRYYCSAAASSAATSSAVDQMIEYAFAQQQTNPNMAVDVLLSGLSYSSPETDPLGAAQLHLALAQLEAGRSNWSKAQSHASSSLRLAASRTAPPPPPPDQPTNINSSSLVLLAGSLATRSLLILGRDTEALDVATQCEAALRPAGRALPSSASTYGAGTSVPHIRSLGLVALASQAASAFGDSGRTAAAVDALAAALGPDPVAAVRQHAALADAVHALGLLRAAAGQQQAAEVAFAAAAEAARAQASGSEEAAAGPVGKLLLLQQHNHEVEADSLTGSAQLQMRAREWGAAEDLLGAALKAAEAAHGERSPSLAPLLSLLGYAYSRSARVTFAEGLFREAAKLLQLDPARQQQPEQLARVAAVAGVHASTGAVLAWRYAQLLWVLPNRGSEAARWESCARQFWEGSGVLGRREIEAVLGAEGHLRGQGPESSGVLLSTRYRRALPCAAPATGI